MNKIDVVDDVLKKVNKKSDIEIEYIKKECLFAVSEIKINIKESTTLNIDISIKKETKLNFNINIGEGVVANLNILTKGDNGKIQYKYNLFKGSECNVFKFQNINTIKEMIVVNLNDEFSKIDYNFKTISNDKETYDYHIFHNKNNTYSNIKNNAVCIKEGAVIYQVSSFVPQNLINCRVSQNNRIINLTNNICEIRPNLYIDTKEVEAYHSALIGKFSDEELFYMKSRGLDEGTANNLLIRGFLTSDIKDYKILKEVNKNINEIWG